MVHSKSRKSSLSRRRFLERVGAFSTVGGAVGLGSPIWGFAQENSGPIDCGPPPKAKQKPAWNVEYGYSAQHAMPIERCG